ncbi:hypothetical protein [Oricola indica]|uniref:hypothetical protein n=1 Tax=Oricola indica TaxID=2872591 RepID=UPI003CCB79F0
MGIYDDMQDLLPDGQPIAGKPNRNIEADRQYASADAPEVAPEGTVWVAELDTYVDADIAAQTGLEGGSAPRNEQPLEDTEGFDQLNPEDFEVDDDTEENEPLARSNSETLDQMESMVPSSTSEAIGEKIVEGDFDGVLDDMAGALGVDQEAASSLISMAVTDAQPVIADAIGGDAFNSLVYAATQTDDPMARRVLSDMVRGVVPRGNMMRAYALWYESLPDAD